MGKAASWLKIIWSVIWPVFFIEVLSYALLLFLYPALDLMIILLVTDLLAFACLYPVYLREIRRRTGIEIEQNGAGSEVKPSDSDTGRPVWREAVFLAVFAAASCIVLNECINLFGISGWTDSYEETNEILYSGGLLQQILVMSAAAPLAEELIFRGICLERLREHAGAVGAGFFSALWFGVFHGNLVQGIYGFAMGLLLALVYEKYGGLCASVWFHAAANLVSVLLTNFVETLSGPVPLWGITAVLFGAAIVMGNCIRIAARRQREGN